jgi:hypothetical protein
VNSPSRGMKVGFLYILSLLKAMRGSSLLTRSSKQAKTPREALASCEVKPNHSRTTNAAYDQKTSSEVFPLTSSQQTRIFRRTVGHLLSAFYTTTMIPKAFTKALYAALT